MNARSNIIAQEISDDSDDNESVNNYVTRNIASHTFNKYGHRIYITEDGNHTHEEKMPHEAILQYFMKNTNTMMRDNFRLRQNIQKKLKETRKR